MFLGVLITGGYGTAGGYYKTAQIYVPQSKQFCSLPDLNNAKALHTQDGFLNCGGWQTSNLQRCSKWDLESGTWNQSINLPKKRMYSQIDAFEKSTEFDFKNNSAYSCQKQRISIFKPDIVLIFYYQILIIGIFENLNFLTF